jgi:hypothetical protein
MDVQSLVDKAGGIPELAGKLNVGRATIYDWLRVGFLPSVRVRQISRTLDVPEDKLLPLVRGLAPEGDTP